MASGKDGLFDRKQRDCTCPRGQGAGTVLYGVHMPGDPNARLDTTPGCPEHDTCHEWTAENRTKYLVGREKWTTVRGPWCPIHHDKDCPQEANRGE